MDEILIKKAMKGNKESFTEAVLEVKNEAYRIAFCYLRHQEDSMDAVCDAVEKALLNIKKLREPKFFRTWFIRIVINECKAQLKQKRKVISLADELFIEDQNLHSKEEKMDLEKLLTRLDPFDRLLIFLKYYIGYTLDEIAFTVNLPASTIKSRIYRNLSWMREQLE